jgi:hypothetical protein
LIKLYKNAALTWYSRLGAELAWTSAVIDPTNKAGNKTKKM